MMFAMCSLYCFFSAQTLDPLTTSMAVYLKDEAQRKFSFVRLNEQTFSELFIFRNTTV